MSEIFSTVLGGLSKGGGVLGQIMGNKGVQGGLGIMDMISKIQQSSRQKAAEDRALYYAKHPEAIAALQSKFTKPLDQGLVKGVQNVVQADMGERGLSQAPGIFAQTESQALAPFMQHNQDVALQEAMRAIGLPVEALGAMQGSQPQGLALLLKNLLPQSQSALSSGGAPPSVPYGGTPYPDVGIGSPTGWTPTGDATPNLGAS